MANVRLDGLYKRYEDVVAVDDMNLEIEDGEFICLVGPSGCGKSTTLEMVAGLTSPSEGTVHISDTDVTEFPPKDRNIAMVFQNIALFPHMDVYDNVSYGLRLRSVPKDDIDDRVGRAMEILQLEGMLDRMPAELSGGQRQRVAIGRAIVRDPEVFLLDEPLANLDAKLRVHMRTELQRIQRELDVTTVYVTHDQAEAMTMSDRIAVLNNGRLQQFAPPLECYDRPANLFVAGFIGSPSMNQVHGRVENGVFESESFDVDVAESGVEDDTEAVFGVRPEDVYPAWRTEDVTEWSRGITTTVDVMEPMGDEIFLYLIPERLSRRGDAAVIEGEEGEQQTLLMAVDPDADVAEGDQIEVVFDRTKSHLFDAETGEALVHSLQPEPPEVEKGD